MPRPRVNWVKIKTEYLTDPEATYEALGAKYNVDLSHIGDRGTAEGWVKEREKTLREIQKLTIDIAKVDIAKFNAEKYEAGRRMASFGEDRFMNAERVSPLTAKMIAELGWKMSTDALGLDKPGLIINNNIMTVQGLVEEMGKLEKDVLDGTTTGS